jgi:hypothetical protein
MMEQIPPISVVTSPPTTVQVVPEVVVVRDRMDNIVYHLKWIAKLMCVHSCYSVCSTNKVDGNIVYTTCMIMFCRSINLNTEIVHIFHIKKMQEFY